MTITDGSGRGIHEKQNGVFRIAYGRGEVLMATTAVKDSRVVVIGLGYVGLPLAVSFTEAGFNVSGIDSSKFRVEELKRADSPIEDLSSDRLKDVLEKGFKIYATEESSSVLAVADVVFVCVPTPVGSAKDPDLGPILDAAREIGRNLPSRCLIILQSTSFPGTTMGPFREALEKESGLKAGTDFDLAFAPERVNPGDTSSALRSVPRLVGGCTPEATTRAAALLHYINDTVVEMTSPDAAEAAKVLENTFRNVNIAFINHFALLCERMGLDSWEVIDAAATKPFGFMRFTPGPGVGGHCIPVDPYYLAWRARQFNFTDRFIELAGDINNSMPDHVVSLCATALNSKSIALNGAHVGVIGVAFKPNIGDARTSPSAPIIGSLAQAGAEVVYHDPHVRTFTDANGRDYESVDLEKMLRESDLIVVLVPHAKIDFGSVYQQASLVVDTVNSSKNHSLRPRTVLRLGSGWNA